MKVKLGVSNKHVHLTKEVYEMLFDEELTVKKELLQPGQFAANQTVTIRGPKCEKTNVRILGPFRNYNQVEVAHHDAREMGLEPPVRKSGDLEGALPITIVGPKGEVNLDNACIVANRHLHISPEDATKMNVVDDQKIRVIIPGEKSGEIDAYVKIQEGSLMELHLDTDDANAFLLSGNEELEVII